MSTVLYPRVFSIYVHFCHTNQLHQLGLKECINETELLSTLDNYLLTLFFMGIPGYRPKSNKVYDKSALFVKIDGEKHWYHPKRNLISVRRNFKQINEKKYKMGKLKEYYHEQINGKNAGADMYLSEDHPPNDVFVEHKGKKYKVVYSKYLNTKRDAIILESIDTGEMYTVATVNIPSEKLEPNEVIIKDYSENEGILDSLIKGEIIGKPVRYVETGFVKAPVCNLMFP